MKKIFLLIVILTLLLHGCSHVNPSPPYGIWKSSDPDIVMYIDPAIGDVEHETGYIYRATYTLGTGDIKELSVIFSKINYHMWIYKQPEDANFQKDDFFIGDYRMSNDELILSLTYQKDVVESLEKIVFTKIQDYDEVTE